jgi:hypothetical protein
MPEAFPLLSFLPGSSLSGVSCDRLLSGLLPTDATATSSSRTPWRELVRPNAVPFGREVDRWSDVVAPSPLSLICASLSLRLLSGGRPSTETKLVRTLDSGRELSLRAPNPSEPAGDRPRDGGELSALASNIAFILRTLPGGRSAMLARCASDYSSSTLSSL